MHNGSYGFSGEFFSLSGIWIYWNKKNRMRCVGEFKPEILCSFFFWHDNRKSDHWSAKILPLWFLHYFDSRQPSLTHYNPSASSRFSLRSSDFTEYFPNLIGLGMYPDPVIQSGKGLLLHRSWSASLDWYIQLVRESGKANGTGCTICWLPFEFVSHTQIEFDDIQYTKAKQQAGSESSRSEPSSPHCRGNVISATDLTDTKQCCWS